jgi:hypothetical protein
MGLEKAGGRLTTDRRNRFPLSSHLEINAGKEKIRDNPFGYQTDPGRTDFIGDGRDVIQQALNEKCLSHLWS